MSGPVRWRVLSVAILLLLFSFLTAANFIAKDQRVGSAFWPDEGLRLGLDLRGGIHWVVGVRLDEAITRELEFVRKTIEEGLSDDGLALASGRVEDLTLTLVARNDAELSLVEERADDSGVLESAGGSGLERRYRLTERWTEDVRERTMSQVLEVLRRRIDDPQRGIPDSIVTRQGNDRVLVQIPGEQIDRERARDLLKSTGFLEFKIVEDTDNTREQQLARYPDGIGEDRVIVMQRDAETDVEVGPSWFRA